MAQKLSTDSYKGVRDFYPEDLFVRNFLFKKIREVVERFGYDEYDASVLESAELYSSKTSEEIVNDQTYTFQDRGGRRVTLRPEMTPTVARLVAAKRRDLPFPLRWYSIPNLFRYEKPQRGRLREHWQLNVDLIGTPESRSTDADVEIITIGSHILKAFDGITDSDFDIRINNRKFLNTLATDWLGLDTQKSKAFIGLIDRREKMEREAFEKELQVFANEHTATLQNMFDAENIDAVKKLLPETVTKSEGFMDLAQLIENLHTAGVTSARFDPSLARGFDYYTSTVFEFFDTRPENNRSLFGGGRYNDLLDLFGVEKIPAVGFGMGDVTLRDFLDVRDLLPDYRSSADLYICTLSPDFLPHAQELAQKLRTQGANVAVNLTDKKLPDQIKLADKKHIPYIICIGEQEVKNNTYVLKELATGKEKTIARDDITDFSLTLA